MWELDRILSIRGAQFDASRDNRFTLWRRWGWPRPGAPDVLRSHLVVIGLNPSTATEDVDDPTIRRCIGFAKAWGRDGLVMLNLFPFRATDPQAMKAATMTRETLARNDAAISAVADAVGSVLVAWGDDGEHLGQAARVLRLLDTVDATAWCLAVNKSGHPRHPLYVRADCQPVQFTGEGLK